MELRVDRKIIIDPSRGGEDIGSNANSIIEKDFNLELSKYIYDRLKNLNIPVVLTRDNDNTISVDDRINKIKSTYGTGNDVIIISNGLNNANDNVEIIYALRNSNNLATKLVNELTTAGLNVSKYYQRRLPSDTSKDYNKLIRDTANNETIIINYGNINNASEANYLKNNLENIGEAVVIALTNYLGINYNPILGSNYYRVKKGDTLYSIARNYNISVSDIKILNNLTTNNLSIGQILKLPTNNNDNNNENTTDEYQIYTIKKGDNLYQIARTFNTTVDEIKTLNNLTSNTLTIGNTLKIPRSKEQTSADYLTYKVVSGDTLYSIAKKYNINVDTLKNYNNLTSNLLSLGQILRIPNTTNNKTYKVVSGDSLYSIAKRYNTTVDKIKILNNLESNLLSIGQILKIPS